METKQELLAALEETNLWIEDQKKAWFWEKWTRLPFKVLDKITPEFIHKKVGTLLDEMGGYIQNGGKYLTSKKSMYKYIEKKTGRTLTSLEEIAALELIEMDKLSKDLAGSRKKAAAVQGATTGIGGLFTLTIDIPALLGISLKTLQEIAVIHGYDPDDKKERIFMIKCLQFASADIVGKKAILDNLAAYYEGEVSTNEVMAQLQGWREVVYTYRDQFGWKKLFQMVPVAGIIFGAFTNRAMIADIAEAGSVLYRKRRIKDRLLSIEETG
ncbi:EcsC family protein [Rossellomorea vietnamensis]|uniref:EcsC family protein n=1 Tax=Rossellomorea vietnamensis TaxID=218284 RepID=A0A5D4MIJ5_9BACI|nr:MULTISPECIES: EcsC family protein [Bacillaceae]TYS01563.1 EcsC family protein [Rossellomorea vietnamensis]